MREEGEGQGQKVETETEVGMMDLKMEKGPTSQGMGRLWKLEEERK